MDTEELRYQVADLAVYALGTAEPAMRECPRHANANLPQSFDALVPYFREHAVECLGADTPSLDRLRLALGGLFDRRRAFSNAFSDAFG